MAQRGGGVGFVGLLVVLLVGLKLTGIVEITWWWVFSPVWIGGLIMLAIAGAFLAFIVGSSVWEVYSRNRSIKKKRR